ncbi:TetR/AcrR family transcriptional regulator [Craurococcus roseus]|uniref:TetR/AcrR family transcriptional regulator n=1 Tax=Craurococcus roseus TaxID=77585 RepID=A0ABN1FU25_9PROT
MLDAAVAVPPPPPDEAIRGPKARAILDAAGELFLGQGFAAVSMDAVARQAGASKATLYAHFPSKDALFAAMVAERCDRMAAEAAALAGHGDDGPEAALRRLCRTVLAFLVAPATLAIQRIVQAEAGRVPRLAEAFFAAGPAAGRDRLAGWIAEEQRSGRLRADADPFEAAGHLGALLRGDLWLRAGLGVPPAPDVDAVDRAAAAAASVFLRAYGVPGEASARAN